MYISIELNSINLIITVQKFSPLQVNFRVCNPERVITIDKCTLV